MKVLHIEDRAENRLLVRKLLEKAGFSVIEAADGLRGAQLALECEPELVLVDIKIPGLDGYEVVTKLKAAAAMEKVPIVAITAHGDRNHALSLGFDGFIAKPIRPATFVGELRAFLEGKREEVSDSIRAAHLVEQNRRVVERLESKVWELTGANQRLRELDRLKMEVLRNVSHELATPITPLLGYVAMLARGELGVVSESQQGVFRHMDTSLTRLKRLIDNLLKVTRFATGVVSLTRAPCRIEAVAEQAVLAVADQVSQRHVQLEVSAPLCEEPILADMAHLVDAARVLLENALKFGPEGGRVRLEVTRLLEDEELWYEFAVEDEGPGIPPEERDLVIEPFYQCDGSVTRAFGGAGLGLSIAERTAGLHGGRLVITGSAALGGARVALRIPAVRVV